MTRKVMRSSGKSPFARDSLVGSSGTSISGRTADVGGTWVEHGSYTAGSMKLDGTGGVYADAINSCHYINATPPSTDYYVQATFLYFTDLANDAAGLAGRIDTAADTMYYVYYISGVWRLRKIVAGVETELGTYSESFTSGSKVVRLTMSGTSISVSLDGVSRISVTDSAISSAGRPGLRTRTAVQSASTGRHQSLFSATAV